MNSKIKISIAACGLLTGSLLMQDASAELLIIPEIDASSAACAGFGDFVGCSIDVLNFLEGVDNGTIVLPGDITANGGYSGSYTVPSNQGFLQDQLVIATSATGAAASNDEYESGTPSIDDAYGPPSGAGSLTGFSTDGTPSTDELNAGVVPAPDPGGAGEFSGDSADTWDITLESLINFLTVDGILNDPRFIFANNQVGAGTGQDLSLWALISITGDGLAPINFEFTNSLVDPLTFVTSKSLGDDPTLPDDFVQVFGEYCFDNLFQPQPCDGTEFVYFNNNLGNNLAEFIGFIPELSGQDLLNLMNAGYTTLSIDERYFDNTNGFDDTFMVAGLATTTVPAPAPLALMGLGLLLLGYSSRRR